MKKELGTAPPREDVVRVLKDQFEKRVGRLQPARLSSEILSAMRKSEGWMTSDEFLYKKTPKNPKGVKIREGVEVYYGLHKARGGLIRTVEEISDRKIRDIAISGDFMFHPKEELAGVEKSLEGVSLEEDHIVDKVEVYYDKKGIESPGVGPEDFAVTILSSIQTV
jgi:lipoate-protein ligase A